MSLPDPSNCPQLDALLRGGPLHGAVVEVPMLENGRIPEQLKLIESHAHQGETCMTSVLWYDLANEWTDAADLIYGWRKRDISVADLNA